MQRAVPVTRRSLFVAALALVLLAATTLAQDVPQDAVGERPAERILMDLTFWALPGPVAETCVELPAGVLAVTVRLEGEQPRRPASFVFAPYRHREPDPEAEMRTTVRREPTTLQAPLAGGRYCYAILNHADVPAGAGAGTAGPVGQAQLVAVKMVLTPR